MDDLHLSFEFFPPKTQASQNKLMVTQQYLAGFGADLFSMTYGAGGSTRDLTFELVEKFHQQGVPIAPHLSCLGHNRTELQDLLKSYQALEIQDLIALRGDLPSGVGLSQGEFRYALDFVRLIREQTGDYFQIYVAGYPEVHPQAHSYDADLQALVAKIKAGADAVFTQYFFNNDSYYYFMDQLHQHQIEVPIIPGIMPIGQFSKLVRFSDSCGAEIPRWIKRKLEAYGDDMQSVQAFGLEVVTKLCDDLLAHDVPGLHFYTLNDGALVGRILKNLGW